MKSADEIIEQKEWFELSEAEKAILHDIAATEKEYNLLKKMLQVSAADVVEVPALSPGIKNNIDRAVYPPSKNIRRYGWLAAACLLGIIVSVVLFNKKEKTNSFVKGPVEIKQPEIIIADTAQKITQDSLLVQQQPAPQKLQPKLQPVQQSPVAVPVPAPVVNDADFAVVTVAQEAGLLDLIAEAE